MPAVQIENIANDAEKQVARVPKWLPSINKINWVKILRNQLI